MTDKLNQNPQPALSERDAELLSAYIDEMLSAGEQRQLEARLARDAFLRGELSAMRQTVAWMNALPTLKAPRDFTITEADVASVKTQQKRKIIPMPNRSLWYVASAAAVVVVLFGILTVFPLTSNMTPAGGDMAAESVALFSTNAPAPQEESQALDMADTGAGGNAGMAVMNDAVDDDMADESPEMEAPSGAPDTTQSDGQDAVARSNIALSSVQTTATAISELLASSPTPSIAQENADAPAMASSMSQTGGGVPADTEITAPVSVMAEADNVPDAEEEEASDGEGSEFGESSADTADSIQTGINTPDAPSNLIQAMIDAMRAYVESRRP